jgi:hypothetical protein
MPVTSWRKSSHSSSNADNCVETAAGGSAVMIRDTANREGTTLTFSGPAWTAFLATIRR